MNTPYPFLTEWCNKFFVDKENKWEQPLIKNNIEKVIQSFKSTMLMKRKQKAKPPKCRIDTP